MKTTLASLALLLLGPALASAQTQMDVAQPPLPPPVEQPLLPEVVPPAPQSWGQPVQVAPPPVQVAPTYAAGGQWVYTNQYGWLYLPYGAQYTYEPRDEAAIPCEYVYRPSYGWAWLEAPWVWGWGAQPYFGVYGPSRFAWYRGWGYPGWGFRGYRSGYNWGYGRGYAGYGYGYGSRARYGRVYQGYRPGYARPSYGGYRSFGAARAAFGGYHGALGGGYHGGFSGGYRGGFAGHAGGFSGGYRGGFAGHTGGFSGGGARFGGGGHFGGHR